MTIYEVHFVGKLRKILLNFFLFLYNFKIYDFKQNFEKFDGHMGPPLQFGSKINIAKSKKFLKNQNVCLNHEERRPQNTPMWRCSKAKNKNFKRI